MKKLNLSLAVLFVCFFSSISCQKQELEINGNAPIGKYITLNNPTSEQFVNTMLGLRIGSRVKIFGGEVSIDSPLNLKDLHDVEITADPPLTILNHQLSFSKCSLIKISGIRFHGFRDKSQTWITDYLKKWRGFEGRGLVLTDCQDIVVQNCSFANYTDDMAGVGGEEAGRIRFENCLFSRNLGIYSKGSLVYGSNNYFPQLENFVTFERCVFVGLMYRTPKAEGGFTQMIECGVIDNNYPIELKQADFAAVGCFFAPSYQNWRRMFNLAGGKLTLYGNYLSGMAPDMSAVDKIPEDQWEYLVGNLRQTIDKQQGVAKTEQLPDRWQKVMTLNRAMQIIDGCGTKGQNPIDDFAKWWAKERLQRKTIG